MVANLTRIIWVASYGVSISAFRLSGDSGFYGFPLHCDKSREPPILPLIPIIPKLGKE